MTRLDRDLQLPRTLLAKPAISENDDAPRPTIKLLGRRINLPRSRATRIGIGSGLVVLGCFGFLPILGFWMIPLGLLVLSYEYARVRRWRRRSSVWWGNRRGRQYRARTQRRR